MAERVLIIDDEENIRQMLRLTLEASEYEVGEAVASVDLAVEALKRGATDFLRNL